MSMWQTLARQAAQALRSDTVAPLLRALGLDAPPRDRPQLGLTFTIAIVALSAKMAKSDGFVTTDEVAAFRRVCQFPPSEADNVRRVFDLAKQDVAGYETYATQVGHLLADEPDLRRDVLEALFVIAAADGILHGKEDRFLASVARHLGIAPSELAWVRSLFVADAGGPYQILGLEPSATDAEVKARWRKLAVEHHPDRLVGHGVPEEFVTIAERKLASINAAYEAIVEERGL
ncbi:MAG: molecular chaperone DjiA [Hyphomicrobiaceae bacterium]|nr:molecular chaperone DjiA [Hyphomicrobiaceae bacterium]